MSAFSINNPHRRELRRKSKPSRFHWCGQDRENLGALTVPHHGQITEGLATTSWFTCRGWFAVSQVNSLNRFLKVIGAGIGDLVPLGRFLSSKETLIVLIMPSLFSTYGVEKELSQTGSVCLRYHIPHHLDCKRLDIPTLHARPFITSTIATKD